MHVCVSAPETINYIHVYANLSRQVCYISKHNKTILSIDMALVTKHVVNNKDMALVTKHVVNNKESSHAKITAYLK